MFEAEEKIRIAEESTALLKHENSRLMEQIKTLQVSMENTETQLNDTYRHFYEKTKVQECFYKMISAETSNVKFSAIIYWSYTGSH